MAEMINLDSAVIIGQGKQRDCYVHPEKPGQCIKITSRSRSKLREQSPREYNYYKHLEKRGLGWDRIAPCYGWIDTNKGKALTFKLIMTNDGKVCENLQSYIDGQVLSNQEIQFELNMLKKWLLKNAVIICDLKPANIVYNPDNSPGQRLILIDGVNNRNLIKIANIFKPLARAKMQRIWKRFEKKYLEDKRV